MNTIPNYSNCISAYYYRSVTKQIRTRQLCALLSETKYILRMNYYIWNHYRLHSTLQANEICWQPLMGYILLTTQSESTQGAILTTNLLNLICVIHIGHIFFLSTRKPIFFHVLNWTFCLLCVLFCMHSRDGIWINIDKLKWWQSFCNVTNPSSLSGSTETLSSPRSAENTPLFI